MLLVVLLSTEKKRLYFRKELNLLESDFFFSTALGHSLRVVHLFVYKLYF